MSCEQKNGRETNNHLNMRDLMPLFGYLYAVD